MYNDSDRMELRKLYQLLDKVKVAMLGADYQTRIQMREIQSKAVERVRAIQAQSNAKTEEM